MLDKVKFTSTAQEELMFWVENNPKILAKIFKLIQSIDKSYFEGIGKPEALKGDKQGSWSRRIDQEHRLVYKIEKDVIKIISCKGHYTK